MEAIEDGTLRFRPLYTTGYVLSELATLLLRKANHEVAMDAISRVQESPAVTVLHPGKTQFSQTCEQFERFDDQQISFVDHMTGVIAADYDAEYIFAFDSDFRTLGYSLVPADVDVDPEG
jgi:predicted nucleic acid-binding protein